MGDTMSRRYESRVYCFLVTVQKLQALRDGDEMIGIGIPERCKGTCMHGRDYTALQSFIEGIYRLGLALIVNKISAAARLFMIGHYDWFEVKYYIYHAMLAP